MQKQEPLPTRYARSRPSKGMIAVTLGITCGYIVLGLLYQLIR